MHRTHPRDATYAAGNTQWRLPASSASFSGLWAEFGLQNGANAAKHIKTKGPRNPFGFGLFGWFLCCLQKLPPVTRRAQFVFRMCPPLYPDFPALAMRIRRLGPKIPSVSVFSGGSHALQGRIRMASAGKSGYRGSPGGHILSCSVGARSPRVGPWNPFGSGPFGWFSCSPGPDPGPQPPDPHGQRRTTTRW